MRRDTAGRGRFYVTTPIYYPNAELHIGHAYTTVACDALARYHRLRGEATWFLTGTDEHGVNIQRRAEEAGVSPQAWVDRIAEGIRDLWRVLDIRYDDFIRTTEPRHKRVVQAIFQRLYDQGDIYPGRYAGPYCRRCEAFYREAELLDGERCPVHETPVEKVEEEAYFFRLGRYADRLLEHIHAHPEFIQPESRRNEMLRFIEQGLEDLCVSRTTFHWGIPVPFDPDHVIYVWIDALTNYISALGYLSDDPAARARFERFWPADVHVVGKEIVRFHAIIWPILLMALGLELPRQVFGHGWLLLGGGKISKSAGNVIDPRVLVARYGLDAVRYFLLREVPFGADGNFTEDALVLRTNADLANDLGNCLHRTVSMVHRFCGGRVPDPGGGPAAGGPDELTEGALRALVPEVADAVEAAFARLDLPAGLAAIWRLVDRANKVIDARAPWDLHKRGKADELAAVLYGVAETLRIVALLVRPYLPQAPGKIWRQLGIEDDPERAPWDAARAWGGLRPGTPVAEPEPIFPRIDPERVRAAEAAAAGDAKAGDAASGGPPAGGAPAGDAPAPEERAAAAGPEGDGRISIETFRAMDLRVARVVAAEPVPNATRLLRLEVDLGGVRRQVVAGIAEHYRPGDLVGKSVVLVANLEPARIRGVESQGMVLAAEAEGRIVLLEPAGPVPPGAKVR